MRFNYPTYPRYAHEHVTQDQSLSAQDEQHPRDRIVGPVGLTLPQANYIIFVVCSFQHLLPSVRSWTVIQDQPWSAQDELLNRSKAAGMVSMVCDVEFP